jgi:ABC-type nitrate/sulfonate/bicarbonate transport system permease component
VSRTAAVLGRTNAVGWLLIVLLAVLLQVCVRTFELEDSVAAPTDTLRALFDGLRDGSLSGEIGTTLWRWAQGLALATVVGVTLGVLIGSSRTLVVASAGLLELLRPIPAVALIPAALLVFGFGTSMVRFVVAYAAVWPILIATLYGVRGVDRLLLDVARVSGVSRPGRALRVAVPAALPSIATGIRISASIALLVCVTAEWIAAGEGLGAFMHRRADAYELDSMYATVGLVGLIGYAVNAGFSAIERRALFWVGEGRAEA